MSAVAAFHLAYLATLTPHGSQKWDFSLFYTAATSLRIGGNPYMQSFRPIAARLGIATGELEYAADTPTFLMCFEPLTLLRPKLAYAVWQVLSAAAFGLSLYLLLGSQFKAERRKGWLFAALAVLYLPVAHNFAAAQSQFFVLLMFAVAIVAMEHGYDGWTGIVLAMAGLLRAYPLALMAYFVVRRRWRVLLFAAATFTVGLAITLAVVGVSRSLSFLWMIGLGNYGARPTLPTAAARYIEDASLGVFLARMAGLAGASDAVIGRYVPVATATADIILIVVAVLLTWRGRVDQQWRLFCLWIATMLMISPVAHTHYMVPLLIPFIQIAIATDLNLAGAATWILAAASYVLIDLWFAALSRSQSAGAAPPPYLAVALLSGQFVSLAAAYASCLSFCRGPVGSRVDAHAANGGG